MGVISQLKSGLKKLSKQPAVIRSITNWPWIKRLRLKRKLESLIPIRIFSAEIIVVKIMHSLENF
jgi:hypothetical protein